MLGFARPALSSGCDRSCTRSGFKDKGGRDRTMWRTSSGCSSTDRHCDISEDTYDTRRTEWSTYDTQVTTCATTTPTPGWCPPSPPGFPRPHALPFGLVCDLPSSSVLSSYTATPGAEFGSVSYSWPDGTTGSCGMGGVSWSGSGTETQDEYWWWDGWNPAKPPVPPEKPGPRSYPHGITRDSGVVYSGIPTPADLASDTPPVDTVDDTYCVSWDNEWKLKEARKTWQPIKFDVADGDAVFGFSSTGSPLGGAPYYHVDPHAGLLDSKGDPIVTRYPYMSVHVPAATVLLEGGWPAGTPNPPAPEPPVEIENHLRSSTSDHGPDRLAGHGGGGSVPPKGGLSSTQVFHPDYKVNTNTPDTVLVTKHRDPPSAGEKIGYATDHWPTKYMMVDPKPLHQLCDFMSFELTNVALLAPVGGLRATHWYLPRQSDDDPSVDTYMDNNPHIKITGSIAVKHRGLLGRGKRDGELVTGYRKDFQYPAGINFHTGITAWWPELKQDHWTPQP